MSQSLIIMLLIFISHVGQVKNKINIKKSIQIIKRITVESHENYVPIEGSMISFRKHNVVSVIVLSNMDHHLYTTVKSRRIFQESSRLQKYKTNTSLPRSS